MCHYEKDGFVGELIENGAGAEVLTLLEYKGRRKKVSVPASIDGVKVEFLCRTFQGNETVEEVRIPQGVMILGDEVFAGCTHLKKVSLSKTVREIGRAVFRHCKHLEEVEIPAPSQVSIHNLAFDEGGYPWDKEGFFILGWILFYYGGVGNVVRVPEGVTQLRDNAFVTGTGITHMKELHLPTTLQEISAGILENCKNLEKLVLPEGLKKIPDRAFIRMNLEEIVIPSTVEELGEYSFSSCNVLRSIHFSEPSSLKVLGRNTFSSESLREITIPSSVERVEADAFTGCKNLSEVTLSPTTQVEKGAFVYPWDETWDFIHPTVVASYTDEEQSIYFKRQFLRWTQVTPQKQEEIKEGIVRYVGELDCCVNYSAPWEEEVAFLPSLFQEKTEEEMDRFFHWGLSLSLAQFETYLEHSVQTGNARITAYLLQKKKEIYTKIEIETYETRKDMVALGLGLPTLEELSRRWYMVRQEGGVTITGYRGGTGREILPSRTEDGARIYQVGRNQRALSHIHPFSGLTFLEMGEGTLLQEQTFENSDLEEIRLPKGMEEIPFCAFANCPLKEVEIPEGVDWIGADGFYNTDLEEIILPKSISVLEDSAFHRCASLKKVVFRGDVEVLDPLTLNKSGDHLARREGETLFKDCPSLEFVGQEGGENQLERLREAGIIDKP